MKNWAERAIEGLVGYPVDWSATGSWVGAIGTVAAVWAAIHVANRAANENVKSRKLEAMRRVELACGLAWQVLHCARDVVEAYHRDPSDAPLPENMTQILGLIDRYPMEQYESAELALRVASVRRLGTGFYDAYVGWLAYKNGEEGARPAGFLTMREYAADLQTEYDKIIPYAQALLDSHPGKRIVIPHNPTSA